MVTMKTGDLENDAAVTSKTNKALVWRMPVPNGDFAGPCAVRFVDGSFDIFDIGDDEAGLLKQGVSHFIPLDDIYATWTEH